jgi:pimeloyl-ACP methyl ester carboxylesterase
MKSITSKDGTIITYDELGEGKPVVLVSGGSVDKWSNAGLAEQLSPHFKVFNYDRRGRGASTDTQPYAVDREIEDIEAVIDAAGGKAFLFGSSSGAALAMEAALKLPTKVTKLALWEAPYIMDPKSRPAANTAQIFFDLVAQGKRGEAAEHFMAKVVGLPPEFVAQAKSSPWWPAQEALAHTLGYDATVMGDYSLPEKKLADVKMPTLVLDGGASFPFMHETADAINQHLPNGQRQTLDGQRHDVDAAVLGPALTAFFNQ